LDKAYDREPTRRSRELRFWNGDVLENIDGVVSVIQAALVNRPSPDPSRTRERE
jgi:hypothetical protein